MWWELPPTTVILHLGVAMALLATLIVTAFRAAEASGKPGTLDYKARRAIIVTGGMVAATLLLGGLTANLHPWRLPDGLPANQSCSCSHVSTSARLASSSSRMSTRAVASASPPARCRPRSSCNPRPAARPL